MATTSRVSERLSEKYETGDLIDKLTRGRRQQSETVDAGVWLVAKSKGAPRDPGTEDVILGLGAEERQLFERSTVVLVDRASGRIRFHVDGEKIERRFKPVVVELEREVDGRHLADVPSVPGAMAYGESPGAAVDAALAIARDAKAPPEVVRHPAHYGGSDDPYEAIKVIEAWGASFNIGSALKYLRRSGKKLGESPIVDLEKARFYIDREIQLARGIRPAETVRDEIRRGIPELHRMLRDGNSRLDTATKTIASLAKQNEALRARNDELAKDASKRRLDDLVRAGKRRARDLKRRKKAAR